MWDIPKKKARLYAAASLALALWAHHATAAAEDYFDLSPEQLLNAEVMTATRTAESVAETPAAVYVISQEDIARSGVTSIPEALRLAPGVEVAQIGSGSWAINIRGFNRGLANQLLVMIDGRTVYNPLFAGTYWELHNVPLEDVDHIEVVRGPGGTLWGANAVNGIINIITKKAQQTQGSTIIASAGTYHKDYVLGQQGGHTDDTYYRAYGQHFNDGDLRKPGDAGDAQDSWGDSRTGFRLDQGDNLTVSGDAYVNRTNQFFAVPQLTSPYSAVQRDYRVSNGGNLLLHWRRNDDSGGQFSVQSYIDHSDHDQIILEDREDIFDLDTQYTLPQRGRNAVIVGGGYRLTHQDIGDTPRLAINPSVDNLNVFNLFAQDKIALQPEKWYLTLGSKVEHNDYTGFEFEPNARLQWFPDNRQTVWASVSRAVRTPSPFENELDFLDAVIPPAGNPFDPTLPLKFEVIANPDFHSEKTVAYEAGYRTKITPTVSTDITAFSNTYTGLDAQELATLVTVPGQYTLLQTRQANLMSAETYGLEWAADWNVTPDWKLSGSYSALEMFMHLNPDLFHTQDDEKKSPHNQANIRSFWNVSDNWTLDTSLYYVDQLEAFHVPAYVRFDTNVGWRVQKGIQVNFVGQNLLQDHHREFSPANDLNATEIPRSFYMKVTCRF